MKAERSPIRVLGIDPGLTRMGFGVVQEVSDKLEAMDCGTLSTSAGDDLPQRLMSIFDGLKALIGEWEPHVVAMERLFLKLNAQTAVPAIQAGGVALLAAAHAKLRVCEYTPAQVKQAVVGNGNATKDQIRFMVGRILGQKVAPNSADAADGLAVAITHLSSRRIGSLLEAR